MAEPVIVVATFHAAAGKLDELRAALVQAIPAVHGEAGCQLYSIHDAGDDTIVMIEKWDSAELLDAHGVGEPVQELRRLVDGLMSGPAEVIRMSPIPAGTENQGQL